MRAQGDQTSGAHVLTEAESLAYERDGFFVRKAIFDSREVRAFQEASETVARLAERGAATSRDRYAIDGHEYVETMLAACASTVQMEHHPGSHVIRVIEPFHHLHPVFHALVDDPRLVEPMAGLVGAPRVALFTDKMNLKRPREGSRFFWHQDSPYWAHFCDHLDQLPNVLVALDDAALDNGCLRVIRGSHRRGLLPGREGEGRLGPLFTHPEAFDESQQVPAVVPAGSAVFFSPHTVHGSEPNTSDRPRRAVVLTYQPADKRMFKVDAVRNAGVSPAYGQV